MRLAKVVGTVCATIKDPQLEGSKLLLLQPVTPHRSPAGSPFVAIDAVGAGAGEFVYWTGRREACLAFDPFRPSDASVTGIVDDLGDIEP